MHLMVLSHSISACKLTFHAQLHEEASPEDKEVPFLPALYPCLARR